MPVGWMRFWFIGVLPLPAYLALPAFAWHPSRTLGVTARVTTPVFVSGKRATSPTSWWWCPRLARGTGAQRYASACRVYNRA